MILIEKLRVYFLKEKSKVFSAFKKFKALVEKESDHNIKVMRFDRGGEFTSKEFKQYCENHEICWPLTVPYTLQQNGVVGKKNGIVVDMARSMLKSKKMPKEFFIKAIDYAVYLSNCSPNRIVWNKTPQ